MKYNVFKNPTVMSSSLGVKIKIAAIFYFGRYGAVLLHATLNVIHVWLKVSKYGHKYDFLRGGGFPAPRENIGRS